MAGRRFIIRITGVSLGGAARKTALQLVAAANHAVKIIEIGFGFRGVNGSDGPVLCELLRQTDAGTMSSLTPALLDDSIGDTLDTTAQHTATAEPSSGAALQCWSHHPQAPSKVIAGDELAGGGRPGWDARPRAGPRRETRLVGHSGRRVNRLRLRCP